MTVAAFLPPTVANYLRPRLTNTTLLLAASWSELESCIGNRALDLMLVDPSAEGHLNVAAVSRILNYARPTPVAAYVTLSHENMKAVLYLSKRGLREVFLHPMCNSGKQLSNYAHRLVGHRLAYEFLGLFETRLAGLEPRMVGALQDLFERPDRYENAADIATESGFAREYVYRAFRNAGLGIPRRFLTVAKILRGYAYLRDTQDRVGSISREVGYSRRREFANQISIIFGCSPAQLRKDANAGEVVTHLVEWLQKSNGPEVSELSSHVALLSRSSETCS